MILACGSDSEASDSHEAGPAGEAAEAGTCTAAAVESITATNTACTILMTASSPCKRAHGRP